MSYVEWTDSDGQRVVIRDGRISIYGEPSMIRSDGQVAIGADLPTTIQLRRQAELSLPPRQRTESENA